MRLEERPPTDQKSALILQHLIETPPSSARQRCDEALNATIEIKLVRTEVLEHCAVQLNIDPQILTDPSKGALKHFLLAWGPK